jgi:hypothetical protein
MFIQHTPASALARWFQTSPPAIRYRCRVACDRIIAHCAPVSPPGDHRCVLLADGVWFISRRRQSVLYTMALKPVSMSRAFLLDPVLIDGIELGRKWTAVIDGLPADLLRRIDALVSDGFRGSRRITRDYGWVHQRCNFHLIASLRGRLGRRKLAVGGQLVRQWLYRCTCAALQTRDETELAEFCRMIRYWSEQPECPLRMRLAAHEFLRQRDSFRAYLLHPELRLPRTVSAIDSWHRLLRRITFGVNDPNAALQRIRAFIRLRPTITCNAHDSTQK